MNYYEPNPCYDSNYSGFDQFKPPQHPVIHQPIHEKTCAELLAEEWAVSINTQPPQEETSLLFLQDKRNLINSVQTFLRKFNRFSFYETPKVISLAWETILEIEHAFEDKQYQPEGILELFRKLHNDVQNIHEESAEYINTPSWNCLIFYYDDDDDEDSSIPLKDIIISGLPPCVAITPVLLTEELVDSLIMEDEHLDTIPETESDEVIKSSVEDLVLIPSESEGIPKNMCDVPFRDNSPPLDISKDQFEGFSDSNDDSTSIDDDSFSINDIDYVKASPLDSELVSLEEVKDFHTEDREIEDDILREKLSKINLLIAKIEAINSNPPLSSDLVIKSSSTSLNLFLEETNTFDNSLTESETFCFDLEENSSGSTTTLFDYSLPDYEAFYLDDDHIEEKSSGSTTTLFDYSLPDYEAFYLDDDHIEEKSSGSTTTHADFSQYDTFIFDLSINPFPPADRSDFYHEEFVDELAHIISPPEYDCFYFKCEPDPGELTSIVDSDIFPTREPRVHVPNVLPTHLTLDTDFILLSEPLFAYIVWIFLPFLTYPVAPPYLLSCGNEDTIFNPGISVYHSFMPSVSHRSGTFMKFNVYPNHLNESPMEILSSTCSPMDQ
ncbi:hypothetical protein Tco_0577571 [Tanacetum coccineum]